MPITSLTNYFPVSEQNRIFEQNLKFEEEFERERANGFSKRVHQALNEIGVPPRTQKANEQTIPQTISSMNLFRTFPDHGFGLIGPTGCGKSHAFAWAIKQVLLREFKKGGPTRIEETHSSNLNGHPFQGTNRIDPEPETRFKWVGWPAYTVHMKHMASRREWTDPKASTLALIKWVTTDPEHRILILDDIGMENIKPESYTTEQLEILMDEAYNHEARVFWTSEKTPETLEQADVYGQRLVSRLVALSPDILLPYDLPDLRVRTIEQERK